MSFIAYKITHRESGKAYIGVTTMKRYTLRWSAHKRSTKFALGPAIQKYGCDAFLYEVVAQSWDLPSLLELERVLIVQENTIAPHGYNLCAGGKGCLAPTREAVEKRRVALLGTKWTTEQKVRHVIALTGRVMPPRTEEHRARLSASLKGHVFPPLTVEQRAKLSAAHLGQKRPPGTGEKIAATKRGKPRTEEAKAAMRAGWARRKAQGMSMGVLL